MIIATAIFGLLLAVCGGYGTWLRIAGNTNHAHYSLEMFGWGGAAMAQTVVLLLMFL